MIHLRPRTAEEEQSGGSDSANTTGIGSCWTRSTCSLQQSAVLLDNEMLVEILE
jgi:hypothetical protein